MLVILAMAVASGCEPELGEEPAYQQAPIVNGQADTSHPAVGVLELDLNIPGRMGGLCTGTLVGSKTVLTAAHCLATYENIAFVMGNLRYPVARKVAHPGYDSSLTYLSELPNDVGIVQLQQAPAGVKPMLAAQSAPATGQPISIIGIGITGTGRTDSGTKRLGQNTIGEVLPAHFKFGRVNGTEGSTCDGDSGGPTLRLDGAEEAVIGVHSTASRQDCGAWGVDIRVDAFHSWIASEAQGDLRLPDTTPPAIVVEDPLANAEVSTNFAVKVSATDADSGLAEIKLYVDETLAQTSTISPATFSVTGLTAGEHQLRVEALDSVGNQGESTLTVSVDQPAAQPRQAVDEALPEAPAPAAAAEPSSSSSDLLMGGCSLGSGRSPAPAGALVLFVVFALLRRRRSADRSSDRR